MNTRVVRDQAKIYDDSLLSRCHGNVASDEVFRMVNNLSWCFVNMRSL